MPVTVTMQISLVVINHLNTMIGKNRTEKNIVVNEQETIQTIKYIACQLQNGMSNIAGKPNCVVRIKPYVSFTKWLKLSSLFPSILPRFNLVMHLLIIICQVRH